MFDSDYYFEHDFDFTDFENSFLKLVSEQGQITDTVKKEYIATARLKYMPVGEWDELCKKFKELLHFRDNYKLCNFYKDNIKLNNKMYAAPCNLSEWYEKPVHMKQVEHYMSFLPVMKLPNIQKMIIRSMKSLGKNVTKD